MATRVLLHTLAALDALRYEPTGKRIRADVDGVTALDTPRALLVWEPQRVVPQYAVPAADVRAELTPDAPDAGPRHGPGPRPLGPRGVTVLTPDTGFGVHSTAGQVLTLEVDAIRLPGAAFQPEDPDLDGYVIVDFAAFETWWEEDEQIVSHPRDPFHRVDIRRSSRHVRLERDGLVLADSHRPTLLFETGLPTRYYLPPEDVDLTLLTPSERVTACAYKGIASYHSLPSVADIAWTYPEPLPDSAAIAGLIAFFTERTDVTVDGERLERPTTPWS